jgi:hypothetical protein
MIRVGMVILALAASLSAQGKLYFSKTWGGPPTPTFGDRDAGGLLYIVDSGFRLDMPVSDTVLLLTTVNGVDSEYVRLTRVRDWIFSGGLFLQVPPKIKWNGAISCNATTGVGDQIYASAKNPRPVYPPHTAAAGYLYPVTALSPRGGLGGHGRRLPALALPAR